jgi:sensor domain CHASE-containing protein
MFLEKLKLSVKYNVIATIFFAVFFLVTGFLIAKKMESHFIDHQKEITIQNMKMIEGIFKREIKSLSTLAIDWSMWDQMYDFAANPSQEFIDSEFSGETFCEIDVNIIVVADAKKEIIFSRQVCGEDSSNSSVPEEIVREMISMWPEENPVLAETVRKNIFHFGSKKIIVASRQITKSDGGGDPRGIVFFGRYIEEGFLEELKDVPGFYFNVFQRDLNSVEGLSYDLNDDNPISIRAENSRKVTGLKLMKGISEKNQLVLQVDQSPVEYVKIMDILSFVAVLLVACYIATLLLTVFLVGRIYFMLTQKKEESDSKATRPAENSEGEKSLDATEN